MALADQGMCTVVKPLCSADTNGQEFVPDISAKGADSVSAVQQMLNSVTLADTGGATTGTSNNSWRPGPFSPVIICVFSGLL